MGVDASVVPGSISGLCSLMYNEVKMTGPDLMNFSDHRGKYSIINRRFTELTSGWQSYTSGVKTWNINQPQGVVTEVQLIAVADDADESRHGFTYIKPVTFKVTADSIVQKDLDTQTKVDYDCGSTDLCRKTKTSRHRDASVSPRIAPRIATCTPAGIISNSRAPSSTTSPSRPRAGSS